MTTTSRRGIRARLAAASVLALALAAGSVVAGAPDAAEAAKKKVTVKGSTAETVVRGSWATSTLTVKNSTGKRLKGATVQVTVRKGTKVKWKSGSTSKKTKVKTLAKGKSTKIPLRVKLPKKLDKVTATITVRHKGKKVASTKVVFRTASAKELQPKLTGRYFWNKAFIGYDDAVYFVNDTYAYQGTPDDAFPDCTAVTISKPGADGCVTYAYDPATSTITYDDKIAVLDNASNTLEIDGSTYFEGVKQKAGSRYDVDIFTASQSGICPLYCFYYSAYMRLLPDGTFARSSVSSWDGGGGFGTVVPPDSHGTYAIDANSNIVLSFADGTTKVESFAVMFHEGKPDPVEGGLLIGGDGYFKND